MSKLSTIDRFARQCTTAELSLRRAAQFLRCGFELEFHCLRPLGSREEWLDENRDEYGDRPDDEAYYQACESEVEGWDTIKSIVQLGTDESVDGGEFRTIGPLTVADFRKAARVLSRARLGVSESTSFHIHLSLLDTKHRWGARFQSEMYAYLLNNIQRMPVGVQRRLTSSEGAPNWAKFEINNERKHIAVHQSKEYGTWEFRIFGNIIRYEDMMQCLLMAAQAMHHTYRVQLGLEQSLIPVGVTQEIFQTALQAIYATYHPYVGGEVHLSNYFDTLEMHQDRLNPRIESEAA